MKSKSSGGHGSARTNTDKSALPNRVKVTLTLSEESVAYFKAEAEQLRVPYQRMIRNLVDEYVRREKAHRA